jgi:hypothetical protein
VQRDLPGGRGVEQDIDVIAKSDVLAALTDVEGNLRGAFSGVSALNLQDLIFDRETR